MIHHHCQWLLSVISRENDPMPCHGTANRLEASPLSMASSYPLSENGQRTLSRHGYSSVGSRSCWNRIYYPFASVTTPSNREFEARHSHSIIESYSEYHRQGLDLPDSLECRHHSSLRHEDSG